jgi:hypothetical protein
MTPLVALATIVLFLMFLLLVKIWRHEALEGETSYRREFASGDALPPAELAVRIFSPRDSEFIDLTRSPRLQRLYLAERRRVASHWVRQTSREVSRIMRQHRLSSRHSTNLNVAAEARLFFQYVELRLVCGMLFLSIELFGPHALASLATQAGMLYQRIGQSLPDLSALNPIDPTGNDAWT